MTPAELIESARLHGAHLGINPRGELEFASTYEWYSAHEADLKRHHKALLVMLKMEQSRRGEWGKVIPFRRKNGSNADANRLTD